MQHPPLSQLLDDAARDGALYSLSLVQSGQEWQANLQAERGSSFRVCHGATPSEALAALFVPVPALPPPPY
jgi:hypothetical protein